MKRVIQALKNFQGIFLLAFFLFAQNAFGQLTGIYTIPTNFPTIKSAIDSLNQVGVGAGGVTFNVTTGHTETIADSLRLTATGISGNTIVFQKSGAGVNPKITRTDAGFLATTTFAANGDAVLILQGSDYVTFDGIDLAADDSGIEYGYFLRRASDTDGCKFVTIKNSTVDLTKGTSAFVIGIYSSNLVEGSALNSSTGIVLTSTGGRHENVTIIGNTVQDVHAGIVLRGYVSTGQLELYDQNFVVGQNGAGNILQNYGGGSSTTSYGVYMIYHNNLSIGYNTFNNTAGGGSGFTSTGYGIFTSTATSANLDMVNNNVTVTSVASTSTLAGISSTSGSTASGNTVNVNNNIVTNCDYTTPTGSAAFDGIVATGTPATLNMNSNTVSNNTLSGTGTFTGIEAGSATNLNMNNNTVTENEKTGASGSMFLTRGSTSIVTYSSNNVYNNSFTNSSGTSSAIMYGYYNALSPTQEFIYDNEIYDLSVAGTSTGTSSILYGIHSNTTSTAVKEIYNNNIYNLSSQSGTLYGISQLLGANVQIFKNNIYNLANSSAAATTARTVGIQISSGTVYAYNNFISDLKAFGVTVDDAVRGISITSTTTSSTVGLYYNSILMNSTSGGTNFGSSGIFHTFSTTATTASLDMRNNIVVNVSNQFGTGRTVAFRRSSATNLNNYSETSNNNSFYAGTPGTNNLIFYDGTNSDQTIVDFKNRVSPRETATFTENVPFVNSTTAPYNLHVNTAIATQTESGGITVSSPIAITDDFDGDTRNASTPDVGADEFAGTGLDQTSPSIQYTPLAHTGSTANRSLVVNITDASGVPTTAPGYPHLYWMKTGDAGWTAVTPSSIVGDDFTFNFGAGVTAGDVVTYYVVAQDLAGVTNVGAFPSAGAGGFTTNPPAASIPPSAPSTYNVTNAALSGSYTVGSTAFRNMTGKDITFERVVNRVMKEVWVENPVTEKSEIPSESTGYFEMMEVEEVSWIPMENGQPYTGDLYVKKAENPGLNFPDNVAGIYATITAAITDLNIRGVSGATTFLLDDATYLTETLPMTINIDNEFLPTAVNTVTFKPNTGVTSLISGSSATGSSIFKLDGADYITFDGSNSGGTSRNLTVENTSTSTSTAVFWNASLGDGAGAMNNTFKNLIIKAGSNSVTSTFGIYAAGSTISTTGTGSDNDNLTIQNNEFMKSYRAVFVRGTTTGYTDGLNITGNVIGSSDSVDYVTFRGVDITNAVEPIISSNTIFNMIIATSVSVAAIDIGTGVTDALISNNYIHTIESNSTGGWSAYGINISSGTGTSGVTIVNNMIAGMRTDGDGTSTTFNPYGIRITGGTGHKVYYNNINLFGVFGANANISAALIVTSSSVTGLDVRNNIFSNSTTGDAGTASYAVYGASGVTFGTINNNDYYASGANAVLGFLGADVTTLAGWKLATGQDANSIVSNPFFTSNLDLHINTGLTPTSLESGGAVGTGFTADFDGDVRPGPAGSVNGGATAPDIGADEFDGVPSVPMVYVSSTVTQDNTSLLLANTTNNEIIAVQVVTTGEDNPLVLENIDFTTTGTTNLADITNAKVWYTGTSSVFATSVQFGSTLAVPTASFSVTGTQNLAQGTNYFWLTFDVPGSATGGNTVDAQGNSITLSTTPYVPTVTNPAGSRTILGSLSGSYDVGVNRQDFNTITDAINALHVVGVSGAVIFNLTDADYSSGETFPLAINQVTGASAVNTITFKPATSVTASINGTSSTAIIKLNGADYVTFDGSNSGGSDRSLTVQNNSTATSTAVIWVASLGTGAGAENNTIKNCNIIGGSRTVTSFFGVFVGGTSISTSGTGASNNNLTILNNSIQKAYFGIYARGVATTGVNTGLNISNNSIGSEIEDNYIGKYGMEIREADGALISGNTIFNIIGTITNPTGMWIQTGFVNSSISGNHIYEMTYTGTSGYVGKGIDINTGNEASNVTIVNNVIHDLKGDGWSSFTSDAGIGIRIYGTTAQGGFNIYYNSINLSGNTDRSATATVSAGLYIHSNVSALDIRDNVFSNSIVNNLNAGAKAFAVYTAGTNSAFTSINYNDYYASGIQGILGFLTSDITTITDWRTATGQDVNSFASDPTFNSNSNLIPLPGSPLVAAGTPIGGVTTDFLGVLRNGTTPTVGAYENAADATGPVIDYAMLTNTNSLSNRTLSGVGITDVSGVNVTGSKPRIYYKKATDANVFGGNTSGDNGWKWTETSQTASPFEFTINYSIIFGGSVSQGDTVQYFVVAQDLALPSVSSNPSGGFAGTSVSSITSAPTVPNSYKLVNAPLSGDYTVGIGSFNKINKRNLVIEKRTRKTTIQVPYEEEIVTGTSQNKKIAADDLSETSAAFNETVMKKSANDLSVFNAPDREVVPVSDEPVVTTVIRYEQVEIDEEYTVLVENGKVFEWKSYYERQGEGFNEAVYPTIAAAMLDVSERGVSGPVNLILVDASYTETYPVVMGEAFGSSSTNLVTIKPQTGVAVTINATTPTTAMFHLNGSDYYVFDGLNSGGSSLTFTNTSTTVPVFLLENGATNNTFQNLTLNAQYTSTVNGVINILGTTNETGNSNNTIINNNFNDNAGSRAAVYVYSSGSSLYPNEMMTITGNHFKNFTSAGVRGTTGSGSGWNVSSNHFFWDLSASSLITTINFTPGAISGGNTFSGNFIGGSAANAGDTAMVVTSNSSFTGIAVDVDTADGSVISENVIRKINKTGTGSHTFIGINVIDGNVDVTDNTIGDPSTANSILVAGTSTTTGIRYDGINYTNPFTVSDNTIANMNATGTGTGVRVRGITYDNAIGTVTYSNNVIHNLSTMSTGTGVGAGSQAAVGIYIFGDYSTPPIVSDNTIYNISADNTGTAATTSAGIVATDFSGVINANTIYNIFNASTGTTAATPPIAAGLFFRFTSNPAVINNMISIGSGQDNGVSYFGIINLAGSTNSLNIHNNTVVVSGTVTSGGLNSAAFQRGYDTEVATATITMRNNILDNQRSGGTGKHYAISNISSTVGWIVNGSNFNLLNSSSASTVGNWMGTDQTFGDWKTISNGDAHSQSGHAVTYNNVPTADLHINMGTTPNVLESGGTNVAGLNFDFDGDFRPGPAGSVNGGALSHDIGADEFDGVILDLAGPVITYTPLGNTSPSVNNVLSDVTITDISGVDVASNKPRIYFKRSTDDNVFGGNTSADNGWKWTETSQTASPFEFTVDHSIILGGSVADGDSIQYFVVAQDIATTPNLGANPSAGFAGTGVGSLTSAPVTPNTYEIEATSTFNLTVNVDNGWNMVSIPGLRPDSQHVNVWWAFRDMSANVFKFSNGYAPVTTAIPGEGYWMKHSGPLTYNTGEEWPAINIVPHDPIDGVTGWNMIGPYENPAVVAGITTTPSGLIEGSIFGYSNGYFAEDTLVPGYGYWIKLSGDGTIHMPSALSKSTSKIASLINKDWGRIIITDAAGKGYTLYAVNGEVNLAAYELPPVPPAGMFDVRYSSGRYAEDLNEKSQQIDMNGLEYPVKVKAEGISIRLQDLTSKIVNERLKEGEEVTISQNNISKLIASKDIIPDKYALEQNYPNPFNPTTAIEFSIPENAKNVKLTIYNALGERVAELINGSFEPGIYQYQWNAVNMASGLYIYELRTEKFVSVKKMMLLK